MPCKCGKVTIPTAKVAPKKVAPARVQPAKIPAASAGTVKKPSAASARATKIATKKAVANNPYKHGCNCS